MFLIDNSDKILEALEVIKRRIEDLEKVISPAINFQVEQFTQLKSTLIELEEGFSNLKDFIAPLEETKSLLNPEVFEIPLKSWKPFFQSLKAIVSQYNQMIQTFDKSLQLPNFQKFFEEIRRRSERSRKVMIKSGWWFTPSLFEIPIEDIDFAVREYEGGDREAISRLFRRIYQKNRCRYLREVVSRWETNLYFCSWIPHINDALKSHIAKRYTLSIPVLLISAAGIVRDYCERKEIGNKISRSHDKERIKEALNSSKGEKKSLFWDQYFLDTFFKAIDNIIYADTDNLKAVEERFPNREILNRHAIFHGMIPNYATLEASLKCFMMIDVLSLLE